MQELIKNAVSGWLRYTHQGKYAVLFLAVLFGWWYLRNTCPKQERSDDSVCYLLYYGMLTAVMVICPVTAACLMLYQTRFYDYEWVFSIVPITAVIAYGITLFLLKFSRRTQAKRWNTAAVAFMVSAIVFLCGNPGQDRVSNSQKDFISSQQAAGILDKLEETGNTDNICLWAPETVLSGVRRISADITLLYGRNMWEPALNAYSYDVYSTEVVALYDWMELLVQSLDESMQEENSIFEDSFLYLEEAVNRGVNCIVVPEKAAEYVEQDLTHVAAAAGYRVEGLSLEEYYIYRLLT